MDYRKAITKKAQALKPGQPFEESLSGDAPEALGSHEAQAIREAYDVFEKHLGRDGVGPFVDWAKQQYPEVIGFLGSEKTLTPQKGEF